VLACPIGSCYLGDADLVCSRVAFAVAQAPRRQSQQRVTRFEDRLPASRWEAGARAGLLPPDDIVSD